MIANRYRNRLVHCHIFKNAGTSLDFELDRNFGQRWIQFEGRADRGIVTFEDVAKLTERQPELAAISSHKVLPSIAYRDLHPLVFLRHPIERAYSIYKFCRKDPAQPQHTVAAATDFAGFIDWSLDPDSLGIVLRDYQTIHLSSAGHRNADIQKIQPINGDLTRALGLLKRLPTIGIVREFEQSCELINRVYQPLHPGLDLRPVHENRSTEPLFSESEAIDRVRDELGEKLYVRLLNVNRLDLELYQKARLRFSELIDLHGVTGPRSSSAFPSVVADLTAESPGVLEPDGIANNIMTCELTQQFAGRAAELGDNQMSGELERFDPAEQRGRIAYEHLHRYAICREMVAGRRVLDLACGTGYGSAILAEAAAEVTGIDISNQAVRLARSRYVTPNLTYAVADCYDLPFDNGGFEAVVVNEMIEHVEDHDALVAEAKRVLAKDGIFIVSTPNKTVYNRYKPPNAFHISEMEINEFTTLLEKHFRHVKLFGTRMALVSTAYPVQDGAHGANQVTARLYRGNFAEGQAPSVENAEFDLLDPEYMIAICSDRPIADLPGESSVFFSSQEDIWLEHEKVMAWASQLHEEDELLRADLRNARSELERLSDAAAAADRARQDIQQQLQYLYSANATIAELSSRQPDSAQIATMAMLFGKLAGRAVEADNGAIMAAMLEVGETLAVQKRELAALADLRERTSHLENALGARDVTRHELELKTVRLEAKLDLASERVGDANRRLAEEGAIHRTTREQLGVSQADLAQAQLHLAEALADLKKASAAASEYESELSRMRGQHDELERALTAARDMADLYAARVDELTGARERADRAFSALKESSEESLSRLEAELFEERREREDTQARLEIMGHEQERLRADLASATEAARVSAKQATASAEIESTASPARSQISHQFVAAHSRIRAGLLAANEGVCGRIAAPVAPSLPWYKQLIRREPPFDTTLFNRTWMEEQHPDLGEIPITRYLNDTSLHGLDPHALFSAKHYIARYPDVAAAGINPLRHYVELGWRVARDPHPYFSNDWYLFRNPDVLASGANPLEHYLNQGWREGRWPNPAFDPRAYLDRNPDVAREGMEPLTHYVLDGQRERRELPMRGLDPHWRQYLAPEDRGIELLDYLLRCAPVAEERGDAIAVAAPVSARLAAHPTAAVALAAPAIWPPQHLDDFWIAQELRDHIYDRHGEHWIALYWYLCSVMNRHQLDPSTFATSAECAVIVARLRDLAAAAEVGSDVVPDASVIVPVYNNVLDTLLCLVTVLETRGVNSFEIIVADDRSSDATAQLIGSIGGAVRYTQQPRNYGFLGNCNEAAKLARGRFLILLNNDTLVLPDWLDTLLEPFDQFERVGLTGSKLLNWDGTLQEAGGIFWEDGSAWNFGRGQDARDCQFNYLKDTDYCSGASIAIPRDLWQRLGGFDPIYAPAYCEDADMAFRIREQGYRTLYQPFSEVIHHEGRSHGRDVGSGIKAYQIANQQKLMDRWGQKLASEHYPNAQNVLRARDRSRDKPHVLIIDHYVPQWDQDAGSRTIYQYIKLYQELGFVVTFWPDNLWYDPNYAPVLQKMGVEVIHGPRYRNAFENFMRERGTLYDAVFLSRPHIAVNYFEAIRARSSARVLYYGHDLHYRRMDMHYALTGEGNPDAIAQMRESELAVCRQCDVIFYPDPEEVELVRCEVGGGRRFVANPVFVYNEEQIAEARRRLPAVSANRSKSLLFVGGFSHTPNVEGMVWFVNEVMPLLEAHFPDIRLSVVGSRPPEEITSLERRNIEILGFVSDDRLADLYRDTALAVAPLRFGAGVKGKVIEAMASAVPIATTSVGAQGISPGEAALFIGDEPEALAREIALALEDRNEAEFRARAALNFIGAHYSSEYLRKLFLEVSLA